MNLDLKGKRVVIAGGTHGIGRAIVDEFAREGAHVAFCARSAPDLQKVQKHVACQYPGIRQHAGALDVRDTSAFQAWLATVQASLGGVDCFVWNVSAQSQDWREGFATDIEACIACMQAILPCLRSSSAPAIVAIASRVSSVAVPQNKAYAALKATLVHYMASLGHELIGEGIRVNCVSPSEVHTEDGFWGYQHRTDPARYQRAVDRSPLKRLATPEEVARATVFLASPAASYVSGVNFMIDAGGHSHVNF